jgi:hypothetical protein
LPRWGCSHGTSPLAGVLRRADWNPRYNARMAMENRSERPVLGAASLGTSLSGFMDGSADSSMRYRSSQRAERSDGGGADDDARRDPSVQRLETRGARRRHLHVSGGSSGVPVQPSRQLLHAVCAMLRNGERVRFTVTGGSMVPFVRHGDVVEIAPLDDVPEVADVVLASPDAHRSLLHRVVRTEDGSVWIRGDAQASSLGPISACALHGKLVRLERGGRCYDLETRWWRYGGRLWVWGHPLGLMLVQAVRSARSLPRLYSRSL